MSGDLSVNQWHLDKRVPVALIFTIIVQTSAAIWWASSTDNRVEQLERRLQSRSSDGERIVTLEVQMVEVKNLLGKIDSKLDRILVRSGRQ